MAFEALKLGQPFFSIQDSAGRVNITNDINIAVTAKALETKNLGRG